MWCRPTDLKSNFPLTTSSPDTITGGGRLADPGPGEGMDDEGYCWSPPMGCRGACHTQDNKYIAKWYYLTSEGLTISISVVVSKKCIL